MSTPPDALTIAREALERIASQGVGTVVGGRLRASHDTSLPWLHWSDIASEAIAAIADGLPPVADSSGQPPVRVKAAPRNTVALPNVDDLLDDGADPSGQPPATLTLRYCATCVRDDRNGRRLNAHAGALPDNERAHALSVGWCPGTVQTLTYRLDAGQPDEPLTNSWNRPGWTGEVPAEAVDHIYSRLDGGAFGTTSKDAIKAVLHAAGMVLAEPDTAPAQAPRMGLSGNLRTTGDGLVAEAFAAGGHPMASLSRSTSTERSSADGVATRCLVRRAHR